MPPLQRCHRRRRNRTPLVPPRWHPTKRCVAATPRANWGPAAARRFSTRSRCCRARSTGRGYPRTATHPNQLGRGIAAIAAGTRRRRARGSGFRCDVGFWMQRGAAVLCHARRRFRRGLRRQLRDPVRHDRLSVKSESAQHGGHDRHHAHGGPFGITLRQSVLVDLEIDWPGLIRRATHGHSPPRSDQMPERHHPTACTCPSP